MSQIYHKIEAPFVETFRTAKVAGMFDISPQQKLIKEWHLDFPIDKLKENWNIGLIVGASGSGKTIIAKKIFGENNYHYGFDWDNTKSFLDSFPAELNVTDIVNALSHVGFSSPPSWLLSFDKLSNGQKFRAEIARCLLEDKELIVIDEFTSVVDRNVAKIGCAAIQKFIRKSQKKIIAVSCHYDIIEWLQPDWYFDITSNQYFAGCLQRPQIQLEIYKCAKTLWELFKSHHYLSTNLLPSAQCYIGLINNEPAVFGCYIHFPHPTIKNAKKEHRLVTLPDYQGIGVGNIMSDYIAELCISKGYKYLSVTSHPAMIFSRMKSKKWIMIRKPSFIPNNLNARFKAHSCKRLTASFKYVGNSNNPI